MFSLNLGLAGLVAANVIQDYNKITLSNESNGSTNIAYSGTTTTANSGHVVLSDFNEMVVKNLQGNIDLNNLKGVATTEGLDFYQQVAEGNGWLTTHGVKRTDLADLILASDIICQPEDAFAAARSIASTLKFGGKAIVVHADSKHRFGVEKLEEACGVVGSLTIASKRNMNDYLKDCSSIHTKDMDMEKTSGFVHGMSLTMYVIIKTGGK